MSEEDAAVNAPVVAQETTPTESAPVETKAPEVADPVLEALTEDEPKPESKPETEEKPAPEEEAKPTDETTEEDQPRDEDKPLAPKSENRFQKLANENRVLREQNEQLISQTYRAQTPEELVQEGESEAMAEVKAMRQEQEIERFNRQVTDNQIEVGTESQRVLDEFPIFNPEAPEYKPEIAEQAAAVFEANLIRDPNVAEVDPQTGQPTGLGIVIGYHASPYQIYKPIADAYGISGVEGQIKGQQANARMLANVDAPSSATPVKPKVDPILAILSSDD